MLDTECAYCQKPFTRKNKVHTYCKPSCRVRHYRFSLAGEIERHLNNAEAAIEKARKGLEKIKAARKGGVSPVGGRLVR